MYSVYASAILVKTVRNYSEGGIFPYNCEDTEQLSVFYKKIGICASVISKRKQVFKRKRMDLPVLVLSLIFLILAFFSQCFDTKRWFMTDFCIKLLG